MHRETLQALVHGGKRLLLALSLAIVCLTGCESNTADEATTAGDDHTAVADHATADDHATVADHATDADGRPADPLAYDVPTGDALELIQFMSDVVSQEPRGETDDEKTDDVGRQMDARILAAQRLEEIAVASDELIVAKRTKLESLRVLGMIGRSDAHEQFVEYAETLAADKSEEIATMGRIGKYQSTLDDFLTDGSGDPDSVVQALKTLLEQEAADRPLFDAANETAMVLREVGLTAEATSVFELIGSTFADHEDEEIAAAANNARSQSHLARFAAAYERTMMGEEDAGRALLKAAEETLTGSDGSAAVLLPMLHMTQNLEFSGNVTVAGPLYELMQGATDGVKDARAQQQAQSIVEEGLGRIKLVGQPFEIVGTTADGKELSWSDYEGKVVLVDFWATWCGPCIAEVPNLRENYERYHDLGFEVVGINLDEQRDRATQFLEQNELPWVTIVNDDDETMGFNDANARRYNVQAIPFLVLVGRDGNVDALHLRGELLNQRLAELLPEAIGEEAAEVEIEAEAEAGGEVEMEIAESEEEDGAEVELEATETLPPSQPPQQQALFDGNPYLADEGLSAVELMLYLLELADKPKSIQARAGFCEAVVDAADRILARSENDKHRQLAAQKKLEFLHREARLGDDHAQTQLIRFVGQLEDDMPDAMAIEIRFFRLEQNALQPANADVVLIDTCCEYLEAQGEALDQQHLRLASSAVEMVNELPSEDREPYFQRLAKALTASKTRDVARYGKRLVGTAKSSEQLIGQEIALTGITIAGNVFDIQHYREQIVVVDFWATWCGPCRKAHPILVALADQHEDLIIAGVNLDADEGALEEYLQTEEITGVTIVGKEAQQAAEDLGIRRIPTFLVVDVEGKVEAVTHDPNELDGFVTRLADRVP